jgi:sugar/nucleoside kinase (ribokinase family)
MPTEPVLVVGSVAFDSIKTPSGEVSRVVGGAATYFSVAASFFTDVRVVAVVGDDFGDTATRVFRGRRIDLTGLQHVAGETFRWKGVYGEDLNSRETIYTHLNVFADFTPVIPESYRDTPFLFLGNIQPQLQSQVLDQVRAPTFVGLDTMNFWIEGAREGLQEVIRRVDVLVINDAEARQLSGQSSLVASARTIRAMGPKTLIIKRGEHGVLMARSDGGFFAVPAMPLEHVVDPTGAGDSFGGGFMGYLASRGEASDQGLARAFVYGSVMASFAVEDFSLDRLLRLTPAEVDERFEQFRRLTAF